MDESRGKDKTHTGLLGELEYLKIKTRLIDEKFPIKMFPQFTV